MTSAPPSFFRASALCVLIALLGGFRALGDSSSPAGDSRASVAASNPAEGQRPDAAVSRRNMLKLAQAAAGFYAMNENRFPRKLSDLHETGLVYSLSTYENPAGGTRIVQQTDIDRLGGYLLPAKKGAPAPMVIVVEKEALHNGKALALYSNGTFKELDQQEVDAILAAAPPLPTAKPAAPRVPVVSGMPASDAKKRLESAGFIVRVVAGVDAPFAALAGSVQRTEPSGYERHTHGGSVALVVHTAPNEPEDDLGLLGLNAEEARNLAHALGYKSLVVAGIAAPSQDSEYRVYKVTHTGEHEVKLYVHTPRG
jgi:hypothetical protein